MATKLKTITPHLWYDNQAKEAAEFYVSIFPGSKITNVATIDNTPSGKVDIVTFELSGQPFMAISAGPMFKFNESVSFLVNCDTQEEIDYYWEKLTAGGQEQPCGWLKDRFGLSWQIGSAVMARAMQQGNKDQLARVTAAFMKMKKLNLAELEKAYSEN